MTRLVKAVPVASAFSLSCRVRSARLRAPLSLPLLALFICACTAPGTTGSEEAELDLQGREASDVAFGMAEAFLNGTSLVHGEAKCLADSARHLAGNIMDLCSDAAQIMAKLTHLRSHRQGAQSPPAAAAHATSTPPAAPAAEQRQHTMFRAYAAPAAAFATVPPAPAAPVAVAPAAPAPAAAQPQAAPVLGVAARLLSAVAAADDAFWVAPASPAPSTATPTHPPQATHLQSTLELMEMSQKLYAILKFETQLAEKCLQRDAVEAMQVAAMNLQNLTYMGDSIAANGAQILTELSYAVVAFDQQDYLGYGMSLGRAARKALLAQGEMGEASGRGSMGPEELEEMAEGLMEGFFSPGMSLQLAGAGSPLAAGEPASPLLSIDLRRCVIGNADFFRVAWGSAWDLMAAFAASSAASSGAGHDVGASAMDIDSSSVLEIAQMLLYMPTALRLCNVTHEQEEMMLDGLLVGQNMRMSVHMAGGEQKMDELVAFATKAWASHDWHNLGEGLGEVLQEMLHLAFPEKYALRAELSGFWHPPAWPVLASCTMGVSLLLVAASTGLAAARLWRFVGGASAAATAAAAAGAATARRARGRTAAAAEVPHQVLVSFQREPAAMCETAEGFDFDSAI